MLLFLLTTACGDKNAEPAPPPVGWHAEEGWSAQCYFPPDYEAVATNEGTAARRTARQTTLEAMMSQWKGERDDGVSFPANYTDDVETTLFGRPEQIETVVLKNLEFCKQVMGAGSDLTEWQAWLGGLPDKLTEGECLMPLTYTLFDYLDVGAGWQMSVQVCQGDQVLIDPTDTDQYRITREGDWINAAGEPGTRGEGEDPCTLENCTKGMVIGRFVSEDGHEEIFPIGEETVYVAQAHGRISITVNDTTYFDNVYKKNGAITDHTGITISPAN
jgi:hypothetical protein